MWTQHLMYSNHVANDLWNDVLESLFNLTVMTSVCEHSVKGSQGENSSLDLWIYDKIRQISGFWILQKFRKLSIANVQYEFSLHRFHTVESQTCSVSMHLYLCLSTCPPESSDLIQCSTEKDVLHFHDSLIFSTCSLALILFMHVLMIDLDEI